MAGLETGMGCNVLVASTTPAELLQAFRKNEDEFFGLPCEEHPITPESDPDEEELGGSDAEDAFTDMAATFNALQDSEDVIIQEQDTERKAVEDRFELGCGCSDQCFNQFPIEEVFLIKMQMK